MMKIVLSAVLRLRKVEKSKDFVTFFVKYLQMY